MLCLGRDGSWDVVAEIAQLGERQTEDLKVPGSIPGGGKLFYENTTGEVLIGVVGNISACHADARGSIPRFGVIFFLFSFLLGVFCLGSTGSGASHSTLCPSG